MSPRVRLLSALIAALVFAIYLRTLYPGLGGGGDATKFQYLGSVLGTAHPPGYPLYVLVSYVFAQLPIGVLAYRINLMSACFGTATVVLAYVILVRVRCHPAVAAAAALGLAFDRYVWAKSVGAEVYALNAFLVALAVYFAIRWADRRRDRDLFLSVAVFGLSLGNHLTAATIAPGIAAFVLVTDRRAVRPRTVAVCALIVLAALTQYGFIIIRTLQNSPYAEARATNLTELLSVMRASRYSADIIAFTPAEIVQQRLPLIWRLFLDDLGPLGLMFLAAGVVSAIRSRITAALLFATALAGVTILTINVSADSEGFMLPAFVMAWLLVGLGMQAMWTAAAGARWPVLAAVAAVLIALPCWQLARNYRPNDHHRRTGETRYFNALFEQFEEKAVVVREAYSIDQLVIYKLAGEHAANGRTIFMIGGDAATVEQYAREGFAVYAFGGARDSLQGLGYEFEPIALHDRGPNGEPGDPIDMALPLFRVKSWTPCLNVGNQPWRDLGPVAAAGALVLRVDNFHPFDSTTTLYAAGDLPRTPAFVMSQGTGSPTLTVKTFRPDNAADARALDEIATTDGVDDRSRLTSARTVHRIEFHVNDQGQYSQSLLTLGGSSPSATLIRARVDRSDRPNRVLACGWRGKLLFASGLADNVPLGWDANPLYGQGWLPFQPSSDGEDARVIGQPSAEIAVPLQRSGRIRFRIRAEPPQDGVSRRLGVTVNGLKLPSRPMPYGWEAYEWMVDKGAFVDGLNRLTLDVSVDDGRAARVTDERGIVAAISELSLDLLPDGKDTPHVHD